MAQTNNNCKTPTKQPPKRSYWYSDSPLKRVTRDLFGVRESELKTQNTKDYSQMGLEKMLETPDLLLCNTDHLYTKRKQDKDMKELAAYKATSDYPVKKKCCQG